MIQNFLTEAIGFSAGIVIAVSMFPQVLKAYKTKSVNDLSIFMIWLIIIGTFLWIVYGFLIGSLAIIVMDIITISVQFWLLYIKVKYEKS